jgi:uncharacterized protein YrrD
MGVFPMLHRYSEVLNLPVISENNGKMIGVVKDVLFDTETREAKAFLLEHKGVEISKRLIYLKDVLSLGADAVVIDSGACISVIGRSEYSEGFTKKGKILGLRIFSRAGEDLGIVGDIIFDWVTGRVESVEVSDGIFQDVVKGRSLLPLFGKVEFSEENVLVDREAVEEMVNTGGGIKNRLFS